MMNLSNPGVEVSCPRCKYLISVTLIDIKCERTIVCRNCKVAIDLIDNLGSASGAVEQLNDLNKALIKILR